MSERRSRADALSARAIFGAAAGGVLLLVLLLGWLTELRGVMHALLITLGTHALVPFVAVLGVVALFSAAALSTALIAEDASGRSNLQAPIGGRQLARAYDEQIRRQRRHPLAWGAAAGLGLGLVGVWLVLAALVVPLETRTLGVLLLAGARLDAAARGAPPPNSAALPNATALPNAARPTDAPAAPGVNLRRAAPADGHLYPSAWNGATDTVDNPVLDAFGRAVRYQTDASEGGAYVLRSLGLDGVPSRDDLCVLAPPGGPTRDPLAFLESLRDGQLAWSAQVGALARARSCVNAR
jgi:hypothetical protein